MSRRFSTLPSPNVARSEACVDQLPQPSITVKLDTGWPSSAPSQSAVASSTWRRTGLGAVLEGRSVIVLVHSKLRDATGTTDGCELGAAASPNRPYRVVSRLYATAVLPSICARMLGSLILSSALSSSSFDKTSLVRWSSSTKGRATDFWLAFSAGTMQR